MKRFLLLLAIGLGYAEPVFIEVAQNDLQFSMFESKNSRREIAPVDNTLYKKECASCHFGYQPGLLPAQSWTYIMQNLEKHYGVDASIDEQDRVAITEYVLANSSEKDAAMYRRSAKLTSSMQPGVLYLSITEIPYHIKKHRKIDKHLIAQKEVGSLARCAACHTSADDGVYRKRYVKIPNYGAWRD